MNLAKGSLSNLTTCVNEAIVELNNPVTQANGTLASAVSRINALRVWERDNIPAATGTLTDAVDIYNHFANQYILATIIAERSFTAGVKYTSSDITLPDYTTAVQLQVISSEWITKTGTIDWGVEASIDNGVTWAVMGGSTFTIGVLNKGVYMPTINLSRLNKISGARWRTYAQSSTNILLGMQGYYQAWLSP